MPNRYPDFFIVGAPKCGTTAIGRYLSEHPSIFMPRVKEPNFFNSDFRYQRAMVRDENDYLALFAQAPKGAIAGEASAYYLYSEVAVRQIMQSQPSAKLVAILRNPVGAVTSYHMQLLTGLNEDILDFEGAWRAQADRALGRRIPATCADVKFLQYGAVYSYAPQLRRLLTLVPREQLHVMIYEEFFAEPATRFAELLCFLGVSSDGRTDFPRIYPARKLRSVALARLYLRPPNFVRNLWRPFRHISKRFGMHPTSLLKAVNERTTKKGVLQPGLEAELRSYFAAGIEELELLLGRSLDVWRKTSDDVA